MLLLLATFLKIAFRLGLDSAFVRIHYDQKDETARRRFAGTVAIFSGAFATLAFITIVLARVPVAGALFGSTPGDDGVRALWVSFVGADILASSFAFVPLGLLRIEERASRFAAFSLLRHGVNIALKVALLAMGFGVTGALASDALASALFALALLPELRARAAWAFEGRALRSALAFGLPKVPHGLLVQTLNLADRRILLAYVPLGEIGVYSMATSFAAAMKFPLSAFEPAWQPFVFSRAGTAEGRAEIARVATQAGIGFVACALALALLLPLVLPLLTSGTEFDGARSYIPPLVLAFLLHGFFLLSSIGIAVAKQARYYPIVTALSAGANVLMNLALVPRFGVPAAVWATVLAYLVMAIAGWTISRRLMDLRIEWPRVLGALILALAAFGASAALPPGASDLLRLLACLAALAAFGAACWAFVLSNAERAKLIALARGAGTRGA